VTSHPFRISNDQKTYKSFPSLCSLAESPNRTFFILVKVMSYGTVDKEAKVPISQLQASNPSLYTPLLPLAKVPWLISKFAIR
jgi:hypothetical protein